MDLELVPDLGQVLLDDVAEPEHAVRRERHPGMGGDPLDPRFEVFVALLGDRAGHPVPADQAAEVRKSAPSDVRRDVFEIDLVEFEEKQLLRHKAPRF